MSDRRTIETYNNSAEELSEYFKGIGPRIANIELGLREAHAKNNASVVEIGCGDGRDASEIVKRVGSYIGFDPSTELLERARKKVPRGVFIEAEAMTFDYPDNLDVVYAFASLLHSPKDEVKQVCRKVLAALKPGGIFYISLKEDTNYNSAVQRDRFGERLFYYYNVPLFIELSGPQFEKAYQEHLIIGHTRWFELALRKKG